MSKLGSVVALAAAILAAITLVSIKFKTVKTNGAAISSSDQAVTEDAKRPDGTVVESYDLGMRKLKQQSVQSQGNVSRTEKILLSSNGLSIKNIEMISGDGERFDKTVERMQHEYFTDSDVREMTQLYKNQISASLAASDRDIKLEKIACGLSVCAALFQGTDTAQIEFISMVMNSGREGGAKIYSSNVKITVSYTHLTLPTTPYV